MKKIVSVFLAIVMFLCCCMTTNAQSVDVAIYRDWGFYGRSAPELIELQLDCDVISLYGECSNSNEVVTCHIIDMSEEGLHNMTFDFKTDESVTTFGYGFPSGEYKIYFTGNDSVEKNLVIATFSKLD